MNRDPSDPLGVNTGSATMRSAGDKALDVADAIIGGLEKLADVMTAKPKEATAAVPTPTRIELAETTSGAEMFRELRVTSVELRMLGGIRDAGGEIPWRWDSADGRRPDVRALIESMIGKGLVTFVEYLTHANQANGRLMLKLTDQGRQCLSQQARMIQRALPSG